jgi:hypothetical protein
MLLILNVLVKIASSAQDQQKMNVFNAVDPAIYLTVYANPNVQEVFMKIKIKWYAQVAIKNVKLVLALEKMNVLLVKRLLSMVTLGYLIFFMIRKNHVTKHALSTLTK